MTQSPCQDTYSDIDGEPLLDEEESSETCLCGFYMVPATR